MNLATFAVALMVTSLTWAVGHEPATQADRTLAAVHPLAVTEVPFVVDATGPVSFAGRMGSGAVVGSLDVTGIRDCDGTFQRGTNIVVGNVHMQTAGLKPCGEFEPGTYTLRIDGASSATTVWLFIDGARWLDAQP